MTATGERLCAWVRDDFGVEFTSIGRVGLGADAAAELWRGVSAVGTSYAVKWSGGGTPAGLLVAAHLVEHGIPGVVAPVPSLSGRLWSEREGRRLFLLPWVSGARALDGGMSEEHWVSFGDMLAQVHATAVTEAVEEYLPAEDHTPDRVASAAHVLDSRLQEVVDESADVGDLADHLVWALAQEWRGGMARLVRTLLDQADGLGRELRAGQTPGVLCHGDPHVLNVLLEGDEKVWLIDWDDVVLAPSERDLMFVIGGVLPFAPVTPQEQSWFFAGYGSADLDPVRLAYYRCARALEDLVDPALQVVDIDRYSASERADALSIVRGVQSPTGLACLALSSLQDLGLIGDEEFIRGPFSGEGGAGCSWPARTSDSWR